MTGIVDHEIPRQAVFVERRNQPIHQCITESLQIYFANLNGHSPAGLYELVLSEVERPLFEAVLAHTGGNLSKAAQILGLNRNTLRARLKKYSLI
ncbi:MAG: DNA-binding protein Fis [Chromatiales bacterium USCg_Taylor]|nr:MAG: DNA-binding protein Fis [Chromatiales bacterium USCg_Taylor]